MLKYATDTGRKCSADELNSFLRKGMSLKDILFDAHIAMRGMPEQEASRMLIAKRNELIDAKVAHTGLLYTGRWFLVWEQMVAFADMVNNGARTLAQGIHEVPRYTMPGRFSLSASRGVSEDFATMARQWGMLITLDAGKVSYYHPNTLLTPKGLSNDPDAVTIDWVHEEEVRVRGLDRRAIIGVDIFSRGERIISYGSFPSEVRLLADIRGNA